MGSEIDGNEKNEQKKKSIFKNDTEINFIERINQPIDIDSSVFCNKKIKKQLNEIVAKLAVELQQQVNPQPKQYEEEQYEEEQYEEEQYEEERYEEEQYEEEQYEEDQYEEESQVTIPQKQVEPTENKTEKEVKNSAQPKPSTLQKTDISPKTSVEQSNSIAINNQPNTHKIPSRSLTQSPKPIVRIGRVSEDTSIKVKSAIDVISCSHRLTNSFQKHSLYSNSPSK